MTFDEWIRRAFLGAQSDDDILNNYLFYKFTISGMEAAWQAGFDEASRRMIGEPDDIR